MRRNNLLMTVLLTTVSGTAMATTYHFDQDPFAGTPVLTTPGRQVIGGELFLPTFSLTNDIFSFDAGVFKVGNQVSFANGLAANLPTSGDNVIVLQSTDNDSNPLTPFGAGNAADLIAAQVTQSGPGFFLYMNANLNLRRLVYSTDLSDNTADLKILARILDPLGQRAIDTLPNFTAANFTIVASTVPEPSAYAVLGIGVVLGVSMLRRRAGCR